MKNTRLIASLTYCFLYVNVAYPQDYFYNDRYYDKDLLFEVSASAGGMNCLTDIGGRSGVGRGFIKDLNVNHTRFAGGLSAAMLYRSAAGFRLELNAGSVYANDNVLKNDVSEGQHRYNRNLHFRSSIFDVMMVSELYPLTLLFGTERKNRLAPYVLGGVGFFKFNPQAQMNGIWVNLHPLRTEGQGFAEHPERKPYSLRQINFPVGAGLRYDLSALFNLRLEVNHRFTKTDYLDDVSTTYVHRHLFRNYLTPDKATHAEWLFDRRKEINQQHADTPGAIRGNGKKNDGYFSMNCRVSFVIGRERR